MSISRRKLISRVALAASAVFIFGTSTAFMSQAAQRGSINGVVKNPAGELVEKVPVRLFKGLDFGGSAKEGSGRDGGAEQRSSVNGEERAELLAQKGGSRNQRGGGGKSGVPVGAVLTDKEGKFEFKNLEAGIYRYEAGVQGPVGFRAASIRVTAGETTEVEVNLVKR